MRWDGVRHNCEKQDSIVQHGRHGGGDIAFGQTGRAGVGNTLRVEKNKNIQRWNRQMDFSEKALSEIVNCFYVP